MKPATPAKLKSGEWGARVAGEIKAGETVTITAKSGKSWTATISRVVWSGNGVSICSLAPQARKSRSNGNYWICPACDEENDINSRSCWECGCGR